MEQPSKRALLETFKYLSPAEMLAASSANRFWQSVGASSELWLSYLSECGNAARLSMSPVPSVQEAFRRLMKSTVLLRKDGVHRMCLFTQKWTHTKLSVQWKVPVDAATVDLGGGLLFACGGFASKTDVCFINYRTGVGQQLAHMKPHRPFPGICRFRHYVYCFAGDLSGRSRKCQNFSLDSLQWEELPNCLEPRQAFNPAVHSSTIYLPNGCNHSIEAFDPRQLTYTLLVAHTGIQESCCSVFTGDLLVVIGLSQAFEWDLKRCTGRTIALSAYLATAWSMFDPLLFRDEIIITRSSDAAVEFIKTKTYEVRTVRISKPT